MGPLRGIRLFSAVFGELASVLGEEEVSTADLLEAAQKLIELSKNEYISKKEKDVSNYAGYFSYELTLAFEKYQSRILINELRMWRDEELDEDKKVLLHSIFLGSAINYEVGAAYE